MNAKIKIAKIKSELEELRFRHDVEMKYLMDRIETLASQLERAEYTISKIVTMNRRHTSSFAIDICKKYFADKGVHK